MSLPPSRSGKHLLGPHVVGQRVVIRRRLDRSAAHPGSPPNTPSVARAISPSMTDVLGVCVSWSDDRAVLRREDGELVEIPLTEIVTGKPVPPRPAIRHRVPPGTAQRHALALFPELVTEPLGGWLLRSSPTSGARRANSVLAMAGDHDPPAPPGAIDRARDWYAARGRRPIAAVRPGSAEEARFAEAGWGPESDEADSHFLVAGVAHALRGTRRGSPTSEVRLDERDGMVTAEVPGVGSGMAGYADDWLGLRGIEVSPEHRRQGAGSAIVVALLAWGAERGARTAYLQVLGDNTPALELYQRLGFSSHHRYRYLAVE
ncbi:MAG: GNAT family N-acetyltransferase [Nocardioides sp.]